MSWRGQRIGSNLRYCHRHAPMPRTSNVVIRLPVFEDIGTFPTLLIYYTCPNAREHLVPVDSVQTSLFG
jgi:hypothetical protein